MTAVDTNVLVRILAADDPAQMEIASRVMRSSRVFIAVTVLLETAWVLRSVLGMQPGPICEALRGVAGLPNVTLQDPDAVARALAWAEAGMDIADAFHLASSGTAKTFATFDRRLARSAARARGSLVVKVLGKA